MINTLILFFNIVFTVVLILLSVDGMNSIASASEEWRRPIKSDFKYDWKRYGGVPYHFHADLNDDGIDDEAWILISTDEKSWGVFVDLYDKKGEFKRLLLDKNSMVSTPAQGYGISAFKPDRYKTACAKGYGSPCKENEKEFIDIEYYAINFFRYESAHSVFYWDKNEMKFNHTWLSD